MANDVIWAIHTKKSNELRVAQVMFKIGLVFFIQREDENECWRIFFWKKLFWRSALVIIIEGEKGSCLFKCELFANLMVLLRESSHSSRKKWRNSFGQSLFIFMYVPYVHVLVILAHTHFTLPRLE